MEILSVVGQLSDQLVLFLFFAFAMSSFAMMLIGAVESLPRLKKAFFLTTNSLLCVAIKRDWKYFCSQRFNDLARTVPETVALFSGSAASLLLGIFQNQIPFDTQTSLVLGALCCMVIYCVFGTFNTQLSISRNDLIFYIARFQIRRDIELPFQLFVK